MQFILILILDQFLYVIHYLLDCALYFRMNNCKFFVCLIYFKKTENAGSCVVGLSNRLILVLPLCNIIVS